MRAPVSRRLFWLMNTTNLCFRPSRTRDEYRRTLKAFYGVLKSSDRYLRFVFLTGVTKFAQVSVFSDLNQLQDISFWPEYSSLCGITKDELVKTFTPEIQGLAAFSETDFVVGFFEKRKSYNEYFAEV